MPDLEPSPASTSDAATQPASNAENQDSLTLKFDATREYLPAPNSLMVAGGWLALLTVVTSLMGCWLTPYNIKVKAPAQVRSSSQPAITDESAPSSQTAFFIQTWVPNENINSIEIDQLVQIKLDSCPYPSHGTFKGRVAYISADTIGGEISPQEPTNSPGDLPARLNSYKVSIQLETPLRQIAEKQSCRLKAGMEGQADIAVGQERLLTFLIRRIRL